MLNKAKFFIPVLAGLFLMQSCQDKTKKGEFKQGEGTLEYQIYTKGKDGKYEPKENATSDTTKIGQVVTMHQVVKNDKDSVLFSTYTSKRPAMSMLNAAPFKGSMESALLMLQPGDSGVFRISADTLFSKTNQQLPPGVAKGSKLTFIFVIEKLQSKEQAMVDYQKMQEDMMKEMQAHAEKQKSVDDENIQKYMKEQNLTAQKTPSGMYYIITKKGTGPTPKPGQIVAVQYRGTTFDGNEFDSSAKHGGAPFEFQIGQGQVIQGWDEGIALLNKGSKATLLIPSTMAYGQHGSGAIPPDASLRFEVELVDIK